MPINKNELTKEQIEKAMQCKTADDLMAYAKSEGIDITREEAEAYFAGGHDYFCWHCPTDFDCTKNK